jgi:hypothetical protein
MTPRATTEFSKTPDKFLRRNLPKSFEGFCRGQNLNAILTETGNPLPMQSYHNLPTVDTP